MGAAGSTEAEEVQDPALEHLSEAERLERKDALLQRFAILLEFERLQDLVPSGIYVMPSFENLLLWHGSIFVRQGLYKGAVFKFTLELPENYPQAGPVVFFKSEIFHPMVDPRDGRVDLDSVFPDWRPGRDYACFALPHLHRMMLKREYLVGGKTAMNIEAAELFHKDPGAFAEKAAAHAAQSLLKVYDNSHGSSIQFTKGPAEAHEKILEQFNLNSDVGPEERTSKFVDWFCDFYAKQQTKIAVGEDHQVETILFEVADKSKDRKLKLKEMIDEDNADRSNDVQSAPSQ